MKKVKKRAKRRAPKTVRIPEVVVETTRVKPARTRTLKQPVTLAEAIGDPVVIIEEEPPVVVRKTVRKTVRRRRVA